MDDSYYLHYYHPNTFESKSRPSWDASSEACGCLFSAGYSAGWCSEAFRVEVHGREIRCLSRGDASCEFIMGPSHRLSEYEARLLQVTPADGAAVGSPGERGRLAVAPAMPIANPEAAAWHPAGPLPSRSVFEILSRYTAFPWPVLSAQCKRVDCNPETLGLGELRGLITALSSSVGRFTSPEKEQAVRGELEALLLRPGATCPAAEVRLATAPALPRRRADRAACRRSSRCTPACRSGRDRRG